MGLVANGRIFLLLFLVGANLPMGCGELVVHSLRWIGKSCAKKYCPGACLISRHCLIITRKHRQSLQKKCRS